MENCSVKQYRTAVNNKNLKYFNTLQFKFNKQTTGYNANLQLAHGSAWIFGGAGVKVKILSGGKIYKGSGASTLVGLETTLPDSPTYYYIVPDDAEVDVEFLLIGLSKITALIYGYSDGLWLRNPQNLVYCTNVTYDKNPMAVFTGYADEDFPTDLSYLNNLPIDKTQVLNLRQTGSGAGRFKSKTTDWSGWISLQKLTETPTFIKEGDIAALSNLVNLTSIDLRYPGVTGLISSFGNMKSLAEINMNGSSISGAIEDFVAAQCEGDNARTQGSLKIRNNSATITLGGQTAPLRVQVKYVNWNKVGDNYNISITDNPIY